MTEPSIYGTLRGRTSPAESKKHSMQSTYASQPRREAEGKLDASWVLGKRVLEKRTTGEEDGEDKGSHYLHASRRGRENY
jgi:hypothetical protein